MPFEFLTSRVVVSLEDPILSNTSYWAQYKGNWMKCLVFAKQEVGLDHLIILYNLKFYESMNSNDHHCMLQLVKQQRARCNIAGRQNKEARYKKSTLLWN